MHDGGLRATITVRTGLIPFQDDRDQPIIVLYFSPINIDLIRQIENMAESLRDIGHLANSSFYGRQIRTELSVEDKASASDTDLQAIQIDAAQICGNEEACWSCPQNNFWSIFSLGPVGRIKVICFGADSIGTLYCVDGLLYYRSLTGHKKLLLELKGFMSC